MKVLKPNESADPRYAFHLLHGIAREVLNVAVKSGTTVESVDFDVFKSLRAPIPPLPEQRRIAEILDTLDEAIRKTEQVIAKLQQMKQGLLHDLLTRGIDENGELRDAERHPEQFKDSPLGRIPRGWEVCKILQTCEEIVDCPHSTPAYGTQGVLVARTTNIRKGRYDEASSSRITEKEYQERIIRLEPKPGDVILTREAPVGEAFVVPEGMRICLGQRVMLLRPSTLCLLGDYLVAQIYSGAVKRRIAQLTGGTTNPHLNVGEVREFLLPLPPKHEQTKQVAHLQANEDKLSRDYALLEKLRKLKQGLMDDLLTGRVRVPHESEATAE
jgi:type I restriction enzyme S subunit